MRKAFPKDMGRSAEPDTRRRFLSYLDRARRGETLVLHWSAGGRLDMTVAGVRKPHIASIELARDVFSLWLDEDGGHNFTLPDALCNGAPAAP